MQIQITNNHTTKTLILGNPTSDAFVALSVWSRTALAPGESATAIATLPATGYTGGNLQFRHNLSPADFSISASFEYYELVIAGTIQNLRLNETSGTTANDVSPENNDGVYGGGIVLTAADSPVSGERMPEWVNGTSYVDLYSAGLAADFDPELGSVAFFIQAADIAIWSDPNYKWLLRLFADGDNRIDIAKNTDPSDQIALWYYGGGVISETGMDVPHTLEPLHIAMTWNIAQDRMRVYLNGVQQGADLTGLGTWVGALNSALCTLGSEGIGGTLGWEGYMSQFRLYDRELSAEEIATLSL